MQARSTTIKEEEDCNNEVEKASDSGLKSHCVYAATINAGQIYRDQIGRLPVVSIKGNKYTIVLYEYYDNALVA
jgi:hypothetical protein